MDAREAGKRDRLLPGNPGGFTYGTDGKPYVEVADPDGTKHLVLFGKGDVQGPRIVPLQGVMWLEEIIVEAGGSIETNGPRGYRARLQERCGCSSPFWYAEVLRQALSRTRSVKISGDLQRLSIVAHNVGRAEALYREVHCG